eukprot:4822394-Amphidinium_carterae.2
MEAVEETSNQHLQSGVLDSGQTAKGLTGGVLKGHAIHKISISELGRLTVHLLAVHELVPNQTIDGWYTFMKVAVRICFQTANGLECCCRSSVCARTKLFADALFDRSPRAEDMGPDDTAEV